MPQGGGIKLRKKFGVSHPTVWAALRGITKSKLADDIRAAAISSGGYVATRPESGLNQD